MNLYTCCPKCRTTFRVGTPQLQASGGRVRCGFCSEVFDAFATLTAQEPAPASPPAAEVATTAATESEKALAAAPAPEPAAARADPAASLYEWEFRMPATPRRTGLWISLSLLMVVVAALQALYAFRAELSVALPQTRDVWLRLCAQLGCTMTPPAFSAYLNIEASDLKAVDAGDGAANEIELSVLVRNRAPVDLPHPAFELTLTDPADQAVARRVFLPRDYLKDAGAPSMRAGGELPIHLFMSTGDVRASGYRLYLFYP
jgi:predicted Zn finger-like uncharacterized protein